MLLDAMRRHSRSFIIYIFFGIIIAVFVVNFGPQSAGCAATSVNAGTVVGKRISPVEFQYLLSASGLLARFTNLPESLLVSLKGRIMDQFIARELMAEEARDIGIGIPDKEINDMIIKGRFLVLGQPHPLIMGENGKFDYNRFNRYVRYRWQLTVKKFKADQRRELLAQKLRRVMRAATKASEDEVKGDFINSNTRVTLEYVRFVPGAFRDKVEVTPAEVKKYLAAHKKEVSEYYDTNSTAYQKLPRQVKLQVITVNKKDAPDAARARAEALLARLKGGETFDAVARTGSDDQDNRASGGRLSWRNVDSPGLGEAANKAVAKLKKGEMTGVVEGKDTLSIIKVLGFREGDLALADVELEIAEELYRTDQLTEVAKRAAATFIARAQEGEKLSDMFTTTDDQAADKTADEAGNGEKEAADRTAAGGDDAKDGATPEKPKKSPFKLEVGSPFARSGRNLVPGIGESPAITSAAFRLKKGQVLSTPQVVGQMVYLVAVKDREEPDMGEWTKRKADLTEEYLDRKANELLRARLYETCKSAAASGKVQVNPAILVTPGYVPGKKDRPLPRYQPCESLRPAES